MSLINSSASPSFADQGLVSVRNTNVSPAAATYPSGQTTGSPWCGYVVNAGSGVSAVGRTWVQTAVAGSGNASSSAWVGIDGAFGSGTVEQVGTEADVENGVPRYYAWYEFFGDESSTKVKGPDYSEQTIPGFVVHPGDKISAEVSLVGGTTDSFRFQITDTPIAGGPIESYSLVQTTQYVVPKRSTAEWIVENTGESPPQPLANFGQVNFSGSWATIGTTTGAIDAFANNYAITLITSTGAHQDTTAAWVLDSNVLGYNEPNAGGSISSFSVTYGVLPSGDYTRAVSDSSGNLYVRNVEFGNVYELAPGTSSTWTLIGAGMSSLVVDKEETVYALSSISHGVFKYLGTPNNWQNIDPVDDGSSMVVDGTGSLYVLSFANHGVWKYLGAPGQWQNIDLMDDASSMVVSGAGSLYVLSFDNHGVWKYLGTPGQWQNIDPVDDSESMVVDGTGSLYVQSFDNHGVWKYPGTPGQWQNIDLNDDVANMVVDYTGSLYVLSFANHGVWRYLDSPGNWQNIDQADDVASMVVDGNGSLYVLSSANHGVWQYADAPGIWGNIDPVDDVATMAVDGTGSLYVLSSANRGVWKYNANSGNWNNIDPEDDVATMVVDNTGTLYVLSFMNYGVWKLTPTGSWVEVATNVWNISTAPDGDLVVTF